MARVILIDNAHVLPCHPFPGWNGFGLLSTIFAALLSASAGLILSQDLEDTLPGDSLTLVRIGR